MKPLLFLTLAATLLACNELNIDDADAAEAADDHHGHAMNYTVRGAHVELFVEFEPFIVGTSQRLAAHLTDRKTFKPLAYGRVTAKMQQGVFDVSQSVDAPEQLGIFVPTLKSKREGVAALHFIVETDAFTDTLTLEDIPVFKHAYAAEQWAHAHEDDEENKAQAGATTFTKEQAWKIDFATVVVQPSAMNRILHAGGEILPSRGDELLVIAGASGLLAFELDHTILGTRVEAGDAMFSIAGGGLVENNVQTEYRQAKAAYVQAESAFERMKNLFAARAVSQAELEQATFQFESAQAAFDTFSKDYSAEGKRVEAPIAGYVKDILVTAGQFVETGDALAVLAQNKKLTLQADVPQSAYPLLRDIVSAHFKTGNQAAESVANYNGQLLSYGKSVSKTEPFIPVQFEIDNRGDLLPGAFVELFIEIGGESPGEEVLAVPNAALLEQYGQYIVFVEIGGEKFERREVEIGISNGEKTEIRQGLTAGDRVVTRGAYQVKMAGMSASIPAHGHVH